MPMEVLFCMDELPNCGLFHLPSFFGKKQLFRLAEPRGALSCLQACCMCCNSPRAAVSEFAEFHSDLLSKEIRPVFSKRIDHLHEASKQFFWHHSLCRAISGEQDEVY